MHLAQAPTHTQSSRTAQANEQCLLAKQREYVGDYEGARVALAGFWTVIGQRPDVENLAPETQADLLWRVGSLSGWIGSARQVGGAHAFAKDLIAESVRIFEDIGATPKLAEAETDLALCYWREGAMDEARVFYKQALSHAVEPATVVRVLVNYAVVEYQSNCTAEAFALLNQATPLVATLDDHMIRGRYHAQRAIVLKRIGGSENLDNALIDNTAASYHFEQAGHIAYHALAENNIGNLFLEFGRFDDAHFHLNNATQDFLRVHDLTKVAQTNETRARVFIAQKNYSDANEAALAAVNALQKGDEPALLSEALTTRGIALARNGQPELAMECFVRATEVAKPAGDNTAAIRARLTSIEELQTLLSPRQLVSIYLDAEHTLTGTVPAETMNHLRLCAKLTIDAVRRQLDPDLEQDLVAQDLVFKGCLTDELRRYEAELIRRALDKSDGHITGAAKLLGMSHQSLGEILSEGGRHATLRRLPIRRRPRRSIIKK